MSEIGLQSSTGTGLPVSDDDRSAVAGGKRIRPPAGLSGAVLRVVAWCLTYFAYCLSCSTWVVT